MRLAISLGWCLLPVAGMGQSVAIFSSFNPNGTFDPVFGYASVNPAQLAYPFTVPGSTNYAFQSASLELSAGTGSPNSVTVSLAADAGGAPGSILETMTATGLPTYPLDTVPVSVMSSLRPLLKAGSMYWIIMEAPSAGTTVNWLTNNVTFFSSLQATRPSSTSAWTVTLLQYTYNNFPGAFSINGTSLAPILSYPLSGATGLSRAPTLVWNPSIGATSYDVYLGTSASLTLVGNTTETSYRLTELLPNQSYFWQIVANSPVGASASAISSFTAGASAPVPVIPVTDFNASGHQGVFLYDPVAGSAYAGLSNGSGLFTYVYNPFTPGFDTIRYGDFNGDGKADLIAYNRTSTLGYVLLNNGSGTFNPVSLFLGPGFDHISTGDLNGDGLTDFVIYRSSDGTCYTAISNGDGTFNFQYTLVSVGYIQMVVADFNGDGKADVFFLGPIGAEMALGLSNGTGGFTFTSGATLLGGYGEGGSDFVEAGDINGDGKADLVFYSISSGFMAVALSSGSSFSTTIKQYSPGFTSVKLFDFNGDGKADLALYNKNNTLGYLGIGDGTGNFTFSSLFWGAGIDTLDTLDLNGDGRIDIAIYNSTNGASYTGISSGVPASPFSYQYAYWGNGKVLATSAAQP